MPDLAHKSVRILVYCGHRFMCKMNRKVTALYDTRLPSFRSYVGFTPYLVINRSLSTILVGNQVEKSRLRQGHPSTPTGKRVPAGDGRVYFNSGGRGSRIDRHHSRILRLKRTLVFSPISLVAYKNASCPHEQNVNGICGCACLKLWLASAQTM